MSTEWEIKAKEFGNCNCNYACPCQFAELPNQGNCKAINLIEITEGHYGDVVLDGLRAGMIIDYPGPIHEGNGTHQVILDSRASPEQRHALTQIIRGEDTDEFATHFYVYSKMATDHREPLVADISFEINLEERTASARVGDNIHVSIEPILNPVNGLPHRVRINLPNGFEYRRGEVASGTSTLDGEIKLNLRNSFGLLCEIHQTGHGVVG